MAGQVLQETGIHIWDGNPSWSYLDRCVLLCVPWIDILTICPPLLTSQYICLCKSLGSHNSFHQMAWHDPCYISLSYKWVSLVLCIVCGLVQRNVTDCFIHVLYTRSMRFVTHNCVSIWLLLIGVYLEFQSGAEREGGRWSGPCVLGSMLLLWGKVMCNSGAQHKLTKLSLGLIVCCCLAKLSLDIWGMSATVS
jgi:hypothetical protein